MAHQTVTENKSFQISKNLKAAALTLYACKLKLTPFNIDKLAWIHPTNGYTYAIGGEWPKMRGLFNPFSSCLPLHIKGTTLILFLIRINRGRSKIGALNTKLLGKVQVNVRFPV